jgi:RsmE family RNA methyltransferase
LNLVLLEPALCGGILPSRDPRAIHVRDVLRLAPGQPFDAGIPDGPRGKATLEPAPGGWRVHFTPTHAPEPPEPFLLLVGCARPQTMRRVLRDAAPLGIGEIHVFPAGRGEPGYLQSSLWHDGEVPRLLLEGSAQAFTTRLTHLVLHPSRATALEATRAARTRLALDNYEATDLLRAAPVHGWPAALAVGPERGWDRDDRDALRDAGFTLASLGSRVLRTETAAAGGVTLLRARLEAG